uniref:CSON012202 protein n=1 Tax=Culicoides sonorensis TaxID=179676 RepID=A0A336KKD9_CULSO
MPPANDTFQVRSQNVTSSKSLAKLAKSFARKNAERRANDSWSNLIKNALVFQRGKIPLLLAVEAGNQSMVRELLSAQTADQLKACDANGDTPLHLAARRRDVDMVRILVDYGTNVDSQNGEGQTALHIAAAEGDEQLVKYFYGVRASAAIADNQDRTPMHLAAENGHATIIEILADKFKASIFERTKDGSTLMHIASLNGHADCAMMLFKKGVYLHMPNKGGARSIHTAARYGHVGIINTLLQRGEKVDVTTNDNYTALHIAVESCKPGVCETLLGFGAEVHVRGGVQKETPLHIGARVKDGARCVLMLLKSGANPNIVTEDGESPLHVAAKYGNDETLDLLLEDGGDALLQSHVGETPLHLGCRRCQPVIVDKLIEWVKSKHGPDVVAQYINTVNEDGATALHYACHVLKDEVVIPNSDKDIVKKLLQNGADVSIATRTTAETCFHYCAVAGNNDILTEMLSHMTATDIQKAMNKQSAVGWTPLLIACNRGHMEYVNTLLANHARVDVFDNEGRSALHLAAEHGFLQVCDALLTNKAFINSKSRVGRTALHLAAMNGFTHLVKFLIRDHNAVIDILTLRKQTPLHLAAASGQMEVCRLLLELGANIDATDDLGQKPIHVAAQNNYSDVAKLFLTQHPNLVMATSKDGNTCAHIAAMQGSVRVVEELMKFDRTGVISTRNKLTDSTPLQLAAEGGHADVVKALVRAGASCTEENKQGMTAVHLAAQNGHGQVLEVMRSSNSLRISSKKLGLTPLHIAAYYGQTDTVRELLVNVPATAQSDIEWKFGLSKLIRNMHRTTTAPAPLNLITTWLMWLIEVCKARIAKKKRPSLMQMMHLQQGRQSPRSKAGAKWLSKIKKGQVAPKGSHDSSTALSVVHLSPLGSQVSFSAAATTRIENVVDWLQIANKYRALMGDEEDRSSLSHADSDEQSGHGGGDGQVGNNVNAVAATGNATTGGNQNNSN